MNHENIAANTATAALVFVAIVVGPNVNAWGTMLSGSVTVAAVAVAAGATWFTTRWSPATTSAGQLAYDAAWEHALADLPQDVA